jgi:hypothetical protein
MPRARNGRLTSVGLGVLLPALLSLTTACTDQFVGPTAFEELAEPAPPPADPVPPPSNPGPSRHTEHIYVANADGVVTARFALGSAPAWSPDGTRIAFTSAGGISVMNVDGSSVRTLVRHDFRDDTYRPWDMGVGHPTWSPNGARIGSGVADPREDNVRTRGGGTDSMTQRST